MPCPCPICVVVSVIAGSAIVKVVKNKKKNKKGSD
tara:strand:+ start:171 stop:275 length:105 start_codon:yes stop_codon:yes gene_type:complete